MDDERLAVELKAMELGLAETKRLQGIESRLKEWRDVFADLKKEGTIEEWLYLTLDEILVGEVLDLGKMMHKAELSHKLGLTYPIEELWEKIDAE